MRWVVGDVQGCAAELDDLLREIKFDATRDELWFAGDLINRGPDSLAVLRTWDQLGRRGVIGNHEVYALCATTGRWPRKRDTLQPLFDAPDGEELLDGLRRLPALVHLAPLDAGPEAWLVHAGVHPKWRDLAAVAEGLNPEPHDDEWLETDAIRFVTKVRCCTAAGVMSKYDQGPKGCPPPHKPWDAHYRGDALIVHGHWARRGHYRTERTIGLDSACVYGGSLTAWCQEEDRIVQVPSRR